MADGEPLGPLNRNIGYSREQLSVDGYPMHNVAEEFGTPTYVYSEARVVDAANEIRTSFAAHHPDVSIHYSVKANANGSLLRTLFGMGIGADCVSIGEIFIAMKCGCLPQSIVFAGVGKTPAEIEAACQYKVGFFNVENELELQYINSFAEKAGIVAKVALRLNPDTMALTSSHIATGHKGAKFGMSSKIVERILRQRGQYPSVNICGLHIHIGSQLHGVQETVNALDRALSLADQGITVVNVGGGFPVPYEHGVKLPSVRDFARAVGPRLLRFRVLLEPGRSIVAGAGALLTKVLYRKDLDDGTSTLIVDASMSELLRPALYGAHHEIVPLSEGHARDELGRKTFVVAGPVCESTDVLSKSLRIVDEVARPGLLLAVLTTGAYGATMASRYNARPLPAEVVVRRDGRPWLAAPRESLEEVAKRSCGPT